MKTTSEFLEITAPPLARPSGSSHTLVGGPFEAKLLRGISSGGKRPSVKGLAYSGGKMRLFGWSRPVVVDMAGMNIPESVSLLTNHVNDTLCRVGVVTATKGAEGFEISGEIVADMRRRNAACHVSEGTRGAKRRARRERKRAREEAVNIVAQGKSGVDWKCTRAVGVGLPEGAKRLSREATGKTCAESATGAVKFGHAVAAAAATDALVNVRLEQGLA